MGHLLTREQGRRATHSGLAALPQKSPQEQGVRDLSTWASIPENERLTQHRHILTYLIPCRLLTSHKLPTKALLEPYPRLQQMFLPLAKCIRRGNLHEFDVALQEGEDVFVKLRIYLALERSRDIAMRNLFRKVYVAGGYEEAKEGAAPLRRTRIPIAEFQAAVNLKSDGDRIDGDEVECFLANMIYKVCGVAFPLRRPSPVSTRQPVRVTPFSSRVVTVSLANEWSSPKPRPVGPTLLPEAGRQHGASWPTNQMPGRSTNPVFNKK